MDESNTEEESDEEEEGEELSEEEMRLLNMIKINKIDVKLNFPKVAWLILASPPVSYKCKLKSDGLRLTRTLPATSAVSRKIASTLPSVLCIAQS